MDDLPAVQSLWIGGELSRMEMASIKSFISNGHEYHLYTYGRSKNIPEGVRIRNAKEVINSSGILSGSSKKMATFANTFRYKLLKKRGGIWVDTDIICLRPFDFEAEYLFASERVERQSKWSINIPERPVGCVIKTPKDSEIMKYCLEVSKKYDPKSVEWGKIGTDLLESAVSKFDMEKFAAPFWKFCPISWWNWKDFIKESANTRLKEKIKNYVLNPYSYHLWNSKWSENNVDKDRKYPNSTIYGKIQSSLL